jgi:hypothetical protein
MTLYLKTKKCDAFYSKAEKVCHCARSLFHMKIKREKKTDEDGYRKQCSRSVKNVFTSTEHNILQRQERQEEVSSICHPKIYTLMSSSYRKTWKGEGFPSA